MFEYENVSTLEKCEQLSLPVIQRNPEHINNLALEDCWAVIQQMLNIMQGLGTTEEIQQSNNWHNLKMKMQEANSNEKIVGKIKLVFE